MRSDHQTSTYMNRNAYVPFVIINKSTGSEPILFCVSYGILTASTYAYFVKCSEYG